MAANPSKFTIEETIKERGDKYGKFKDGAVIMQNLKMFMRSTQGWGGLTPSQQESLEMIQHKIGRILNGDPRYVENFTDIAGYATLICNELKLTDGATDAKVIYTERVCGTWIDKR